MGSAGCEQRAREVQSEAELKQAVQQMTPAVERATRLRFRQRPVVLRRTRAQVRDYVIHKFDDDLPPAELEGAQAAYRLFGLIPDSLDLRRTMVDLLTEQVAGYFDPDSNALYIPTDIDPSQARLVISHELVHALQHQYLNLDSLVELKRQNDRRTAAQAILEGQATLAQILVLMPEQKLESLPNFWDLRTALGAQQDQMKVFGSAPLWLRESLIFPYLGGAEFVRWFDHEYPGKQPYGVLMPISTEQILHPARYVAGDRPDALAFEPVLVAHRVGRGRLECQRVGPVPGHVTRRVQDLLGGDRHEDPIGLLPGVLVVEPAHEFGAAQVREDQALAQPQRCAPEHLHLILLRAQGRSQVPEVGQAFELLLRHEDQDLRQCRLPLEDRLRRRAAIVLALELHQGVEVQVLVLQRVHQLVGDHETRLAGIDVGRDIQGVRVGVEVSRNLLRQEIDHRAAQVERIGNQTEQPVRRLRALELGGREVIVELVDDVVPDLRAAAAQHDGTLAKPQPGGPLDGGDHLQDGLLQVGLALDLPCPLLASGAAHRSNDRHGSEPRAGHACHSIPLPTADPTTRATSCPDTIIPWRSSSSRSSRSSSARRSARVGGRWWRLVEVGEVGEGCTSTDWPPLTSPDLPWPPPPSIFSISVPMRSSIGRMSVIRSSAASCGGRSCVRPRRIMASTLRRSRISRSSSGDTRAVACAWAQASSNTSMALSGRARSGTNRSVKTIAALSASSVLATAW